MKIKGLKKLIRKLSALGKTGIVAYAGAIYNQKGFPMFIGKLYQKIKVDSVIWNNYSY